MMEQSSLLNKFASVDRTKRTLVVCGSINQAAAEKHQKDNYKHQADCYAAGDGMFVTKRNMIEDIDNDSLRCG